MGKLTLYDIFLSIKQNLSHAWIPGPYVLGKLILIDIFLSVKQNLSHARLLGSHVLGNAIQLQSWSLSALLSVHLNPNEFLLVIHRGSPFVFGIFGLLCPLQKNHLGLLHFLYFPLFLQIRTREQSDCCHRERRRRGEIRRKLSLRGLLG